MKAKKFKLDSKYRKKGDTLGWIKTGKTPHDVITDIFRQHYPFSLYDITEDCWEEVIEQNNQGEQT